MTLYECRYQWPESPRRTPQEANEAFGRVFAAAEATDRRAMLRSWYQYPGEAAGFLVLDVDSAEALHAFMAPYMELMTLEARPLMEHDYVQRRQEVVGEQA
jgi:muconolactone delta-isomerase